jgi:hypothetical protein
VPGSLDKKGGRKVPSTGMFHLFLIKDCTVFPLFCLTNPALDFSQEKDVPQSNVLLLGSKSPESYAPERRFRGTLFCSVEQQDADHHVAAQQCCQGGQNVASRAQ